MESSEEGGQRNGERPPAFHLIQPKSQGYAQLLENGYPAKWRKTLDRRPARRARRGAPAEAASPGGTWLRPGVATPHGGGGGGRHSTHLPPAPPSAKVPLPPTRAPRTHPTPQAGLLSAPLPTFTHAPPPSGETMRVPGLCRGPH